MPGAVCQVMTMLCALTAPLPIGTNLGLLHLLWMLVSGRLLAARGAIIPALSEMGVTDGQVRRAWAALGQGAWASDDLVGRWAAPVEQAGQWRPHRHGGYRPVAVDVTAFWRPRLRGCPTAHSHAVAQKALPAIPLGLIARIGSAAGQRVGLPLGLVRADPADPSPRAHMRRLVEAAVARCASRRGGRRWGLRRRLAPRGGGGRLRRAPGQERHRPPTKAGAGHRHAGNGCARCPADTRAAS